MFYNAYVFIHEKFLEWKNFLVLSNNQGSNRGGRWPGVVSFFLKKFWKNVSFLYDFLALFWKIDPLKPVFCTIHEGYPNFFHESKIFPKIEFYCIFMSLFFKKLPKFSKTAPSAPKVCFFFSFTSPPPLFGPGLKGAHFLNFRRYRCRKGDHLPGCEILVRQNFFVQNLIFPRNIFWLGANSQ